MDDNKRQSSEAGGAAIPNRAPDTINAAPPSADASQQPGFKVVDEAPSRGGRKLIWTAVVVVVAIAVGYYLGYFR